MPFGKSSGFQVPDSSPPQVQPQVQTQARTQAWPQAPSRNQNPFSTSGRDDNQSGSDDGSRGEGSVSDGMDEDARPGSRGSTSGDYDDDDDDDDMDGIDDDNLEKAKANGLVGTVYSLNGGKSSLLNDSMNKSSLWQRQLQKSIPKMNIDLTRTIKSIATSVKAAPLHEPDDVILQTENALRMMYRSSRIEYSTDNTDAIYGAAETLARMWREYALEEFNNNSENQGTPLWRANYIASLALELQYPPRKRGGRSHNMSLARLSQLQGTQKPIPRVLLDWKVAYHESETDRIFEIQSHKPNSTAHPEFWDVILDCLLNGKLESALSILKGADFSYASTAEDDGLDTNGYGVRYVENIRVVIDNAIEVIGSAPAVQTGDWDVKNNDWALFRNRISQAISDLRDFAEGDTGRSQPGRGTNSFTAESFGISGYGNTSLNLSTASRRATSPIPWSIYQKLKQIYLLLQGDADAIISASIDWTDAVIGLAVWWDGEEEDISRSSLALRRRTAPRPQRARPADVTPVLAYQNRLAASLVRVTQDNESQMAINTMDNEEVGLAALFTGDVESVVSIVCAFSMTIGTALAEVADAGDWLAKRPGMISRALDESDLIMLNHSQGRQDSSIRDTVLVRYAKLLAERDVIEDSRSEMAEEGWEIAMRIIARLQDAEMATRQIKQFLDEFQLDSSERVDKIVKMCNNLGFEKEARKIAEVYKHI